MITGIFHPGSGLGNQLFRYIATRTLATQKGYKFSMIAPENFKGKSFMKLKTGVQSTIEYHVESGAGKIIPHAPLWEEKTNYYNPEYNFVEDNLVIDGEFQDERYFNNNDEYEDSGLNEVDDWLKVKNPYPKTSYEDIVEGTIIGLGEAPDDLCVIGFRGGEFYVFPELGLPKSYFEQGIEIMKSLNPKMRFEVHTDDPTLAKQFFPEFAIIHDIEKNWVSMRYAKYAIIANSSFYILPRLLSNYMTIAPRYWARRNTKEWSMPQNYYKRFIYI